jgi:hypothetical protein
VHKLRSHKLKSKMLELDFPDYQRRKRMHGMLAGDAGAALEYLQNLQVSGFLVEDSASQSGIYILLMESHNEFNETFCRFSFDKSQSKQNF